MPIQSINPATEEVLAEYQEMTDAEVDQALSQAQAAFEQWRQTPLTERSAKLRNLAAALRNQQTALARLATLEMGKPVVQAEAEVEKCAVGCEYYAANAERLLANEYIAVNGAESYVAYRPVGVILAIMPWNFPYWQVFRPLAPSVLLGNAVVLKHASNVPQCALAIERLMLEAGFPEGLMRALLVSGQRVEPIIHDPRIRLVTLTGSDEAGRQVASIAGRSLKKTVLELGGSDPFIVLPDADLDAAARTAALARTQNSGQSCIAAKRFLVVGSVADEFERRFCEAIASLKVGDPLDRTTNIGPLARDDLRDRLTAQVQASVAQGATVAIGGGKLPGRGYFFAPTVLTDVQPSMAVFREETFGPVAAIVRVRDHDHAIALANDSLYGLGASIFSQDVACAQQVASRIESGQVFINGMVASDPRLPFGGVKCSGYGRELSSFGLRELANIQTVWVGPAAKQ